MLATGLPQDDHSGASTVPVRCRGVFAHCTTEVHGSGAVETWEELMRTCMVSRCSSSMYATAAARATFEPVSRRPPDSTSRSCNLSRATLCSCSRRWNSAHKPTHLSLNTGIWYSRQQGTRPSGTHEKCVRKRVKQFYSIFLSKHSRTVERVEAVLVRAAVASLRITVAAW